jgi:hypothetical protein
MVSQPHAKGIHVLDIAGAEQGQNVIAKGKSFRGGGRLPGRGRIS